MIVVGYFETENIESRKLNKYAILIIDKKSVLMAHF